MQGINKTKIQRAIVDDFPDPAPKKQQQDPRNKSQDSIFWQRLAENRLESGPRWLTWRGRCLEFTRAIHGIQFHFEGPQARAPNGWRIAAGIRAPVSAPPFSAFCLRSHFMSL